MSLFSIITICKNNLKDLEITFESISSQSCKNFEWIVIDGGSTDGTKDWLSGNNLTTQWLSESDKGIYDAMNKGIKLTSGKYLIFMNSADEFADHNILLKVEKEIEEQQKDPVLIFGDSLDVEEDGKEHYRKAKDFSRIKYGMITQHQAMFFNRQLSRDIHFEEKFKLSADYAMICRLIKNRETHSILKLDYPICKFKMGGVNEQKRYKAIHEDFQIRKNILDLNSFEASFLYLLHFIHTIVKHTFSKSRFAMHKSINP